MDELLRQLVASLQASAASAGAEISIGTDGALSRVVSNLTLAGQIAVEGEAEAVGKLIAELRADVQTTIGELREIEAAAYFFCMEVTQKAGKCAGEGATLPEPAPVGGP